MTHVFDRATVMSRIEPDRFEVELSREFWVGESGPWGGYVSALFTKAIAETMPGLSILSLTVHFVDRLEGGAATVVVAIERRGTRIGHASARLVQGDRCGAIALATLGNNPQPDLVTDFVRPDVPPPAQVRRRAESTHPYMQHIDVRPTTVIKPWSGGNEGTLAGWINLVEPRALDVPLLAALPDAWMPGMWARLETPAGKITVDLTTHFRAEISENDVGWWFVRLRTCHVERGFADEECEVWGGDGRFLAQSRQLVMLGRR